MTGIHACGDEPLNVVQRLDGSADRLRVVDARGDLDLFALNRNSLCTRLKNVSRLRQHGSYSVHVIPKGGWEAADELLRILHSARVWRGPAGARQWPTRSRLGPGLGLVVRGLVGPRAVYPVLIGLVCAGVSIWKVKPLPQAHCTGTTSLPGPVPQPIRVT